MSEERFFQLISRKFANEATVDELTELEALMEQNKYFCDLYLQLISGSQLKNERDEDDADASFAVHAMKMQLLKEDQASFYAAQTESPSPLPQRFIPTRRYFSVAAVVLLLIGASFFLNRSKTLSPAAEVNEVVSRKGSKSILTLPDGTKVWLNADSKLAYGNFSGKTREVTLTGEAFFDVVKDSTRAFIIHADKINIRVLGTAFNVKSYPQDETIETSLIHGEIELTYTERPSEKFVLHPNEKLTIKKNQNAVATATGAVPKIQFNNMTATKDSLLPETAWMENKLAFSNETLEGIARNLERQFDVTIEFKSEEPKQYTYTGLFEHESIEKILHVLSVSQSFRYAVNGTHITIENESNR